MSSKCLTPASVGGGNTGRNKVALKPGKSLMDWIRFTHSGKDLTSVGGKICDITAEELSKHNKKEDAWICLRGKVYNVTPYLEYHPGGEDELMRGAGKDATDLFNQIHRWVNAESMLQKCYVGRMNMSSLWLQKATAFPAPKLPAPVSKSVAVISVPDELDGTVENMKLKSSEGTVQSANEKICAPKFDWIQSETNINISICTPEGTISSEDVIIDLVARDLFVVLHMKSYLYNLHVELEGSVSPMYDVKIGEGNNTVEIVLSKDSSEGIWEDLGKPLNNHNTFIASTDEEIRYRPCKLISKTPVTHNTVLLECELSSGTRMIVPMGHHVHLTASIDDMEIVRSYTPVLHSLHIPTLHPSLTEGRLIYLMIKIYPDGALTPLIDKCQIGENLLISDYIGDFSKKRVQECSSLILLAAGTGFTPMVKLIHWAFECRSDDSRSVTLVFFNKTEKDILWKDNLESLCQSNKRFQVHHVLSEPEEGWNGRKGRISLQLLQELFTNSFMEPGIFSCVCGPLSFTQLTLQYLEEVGCRKDAIHAFCG